MQTFNFCHRYIDGMVVIIILVRRTKSLQSQFQIIIILFHLPIDEKSKELLKYGFADNRIILKLNCKRLYTNVVGESHVKFNPGRVSEK